MRDRDRRACPRGHVGKFKRDVTTADEQNMLREDLEFEKIVTGNSQLFARDA